MIGDKIKVNGIDLLILDERDNEIFVWAYDTGIKTKFDDKSSNYNGSYFQRKTIEWFYDTKITPSSCRELDLMAISGEKEYGKIDEDAAPLTFDEYRKYYEVIKPNIKHEFWTCTAYNTRGSSGICRILLDGGISYYTCSSNLYFAPALWISKDYLTKENENKNPFDAFSTAEIADELARRIREGL